MNQVAAPDVKPGIASTDMRHFSRFGYWLKRKDEPSNRKRAEVSSVRLTPVQGVVETSRRRTSRRCAARPIGDSCSEAPASHHCGLGPLCPEPLNPVITKKKGMLRCLMS